VPPGLGTPIPTSLPNDEWVQHMRQFIRTSDENLLRGCHGVLESYQDLYLNYMDFIEFFDDLGVMEVLSAENVQSAEEFIDKLDKELKGKPAPEKL